MEMSLFPLHPPTGERIILMDLNVALSENFREMRRYSFVDFIKSHERYRQWMVDLLKPEYTILITARDKRWAKDTLLRIHDQTGWQPNEALFNDTGLSGANAPLVKQTLFLQYVLPNHGEPRSKYLAIESNSATREMYSLHQIRAVDCAREGRWFTLPS